MSAATWRSVARKDFEDAARSKMLWGLIATFVGFTSFLLFVLNATTDTSSAGPQDALAFVGRFGQLFIPLIALVAGYMAVVGERRSGSLRVLLNYPISRSDVVLGKLVGRAAVIGVTLVAGILLSTAVAAALFGVPALAKLAMMVGFVVLFGLAFTGIAVGVSAACDTRGKAMALAVGLFIVFFIAWDGLVAGAYYAATGGLPGLEVEGWYFFLQRLNPIVAFRQLLDGALAGDVGPMVRLPVNDVPKGTPRSAMTMANRVPGDVPLYLKDWVMGAVLLAWAVVPGAVGYRRFERADLG